MSNKIGALNQTQSLAFIAEAAANAVQNPVSAKKEAALAQTIAKQGASGAQLINAESLDHVRGLDDGLRARGIIGALATAYGEDLKTVLFTQPTVAEFAMKLLSLAGNGYDGSQERGAVSRFVAGYTAPGAVKSKDGIEVDTNDVKNARETTDRKLGTVLSFGESFGVVKQDGSWKAYFQNDWNKDVMPLDKLSSATLLAIVDLASSRPELRSLGKQAEKELAPRLKESNVEKTKVDKNLSVELDQITPTELKSAPGDVRVSRQGMQVVLDIISLISGPLTAVVKGSEWSFPKFSQRNLSLGDDYAHISHKDQLLASNKVTIQWSPPNEKYPHEGGLIQLAGGEFRLWRLTDEKQGSGYKRAYTKLDAMDTASLKGLYGEISKMAPSGAGDATIREGRMANRFGPSLEQLKNDLATLIAARS